MMQSNTKNVTFALPLSMMEELRDLVKSKKNERKITVNSVVRSALERYLLEVKQEKLRQDMIEASKDPLFLADVEDCATVFRFSDKEGIHEW